MKLPVDIYIDGASKGNPGHAGVGVIICQDGNILKNISHYIGEATNNIAEYTALNYALQEALVLKAERITVYTDSELLYRQIRREYKVKNPAIANLFIQATRMLSAFKEAQVRHIPRTENRGADKLATKAIKEALKSSSGSQHSKSASVNPKHFLSRAGVNPQALL
jgi:ribonuclease HI